MANDKGQTTGSVLFGSLAKGLQGVQQGLEQKRQNDLQNLMMAMKVQDAEMNRDAFLQSQQLREQQMQNAQQTFKMNQLKLTDMLKSDAEREQDKLDAERVRKEDFILQNLPDNALGNIISGVGVNNFQPIGNLEGEGLASVGRVAEALPEGVRFMTPWGEIQNKEYKPDKYTSLTAADRFIQDVGGDTALFNLYTRGKMPWLSAKDQLLVDEKGPQALVRLMEEGKIPQLSAKDQAFINARGAEAWVQAIEKEQSGLSGKDYDVKEYISSVFGDPKEAQKEWIGYIRAGQDKTPQLSARDREVRDYYYSNLPVPEARQQWVNYIETAQGTKSRTPVLSAKDKLQMDAMIEVFGDEETTKILANQGAGLDDSSKEKLRQLTIASKERTLEAQKVLEQANSVLNGLPEGLREDIKVGAITNVKDFKEVTKQLLNKRSKLLSFSDDDDKAVDQMFTLLDKYNKIIADVRGSIKESPTETELGDLTISELEDAEGRKIYDDWDDYDTATKIKGLEAEGLR